MPESLPARACFALEIMAPQPHERVLEVGCGSGRLAEAISADLTTGWMLALDRSAHAVASAVEHTAAAIDRGVLRVSRGSLAGLTADPFHVALAVNVNVFWTEDADDELSALVRALAPGGRLGILYGRGPQDGSNMLQGIAAKVEKHGFSEVRIVTDDRGSGVVARR